jgi:hypothetical protein
MSLAKECAKGKKSVRPSSSVMIADWNVWRMFCQMVCVRLDHPFGGPVVPAV